MFGRLEPLQLARRTQGESCTMHSTCPLAPVTKDFYWLLGACAIAFFVDFYSDILLFDFLPASVLEFDFGSCIL